MTFNKKYREIQKIIKNELKHINEFNKSTSFALYDDLNSFLLEMASSKKVETAIKVLTCGDINRITNYLLSDFQTLPQRVQKFIFHHTTDLTIDGTSIYNTQNVSIWQMFKMDGGILTSFDPIFLQRQSILNLFKNKAFRQAELPDVMPIFINTFDVDASLNEVLGYVKELAEITTFSERTGEKEPYFSSKHLVDLLKRKYLKPNLTKSFTVKQCQEFIEKIEKLQKVSSNLRKIDFSSDWSLYMPFLVGDHGYENYLELTKRSEIKEALFSSRNSLNFNNVLRYIPDRAKLELLSEYMQRPDYKITELNNDTIITQCFQSIKDKSSLLDFDLTLPIFERLVFSKAMGAEYLLKPHFLDCLIKPDNSSKSERNLLAEISSLETLKDAIKASVDESERRAKAGVKEIDRDETKKERLKTLVTELVTVGLIDKNTYERVLEIGQEYNKNLTIEKIKAMVQRDENLKYFLESVTKQWRGTFAVRDGNYPENVTSPYERAMYDLEVIYPKTRLQGLPHFDAFRKMSLEQKRKFDLKTWDKFSPLPLFNQNDNTKKALVEFIALMGLFEDDAQVEARRARAFKITQLAGKKFSKKEERLHHILIELHDKLYGYGNLPPEFEGKKSVTLKEVEEYISSKFFLPCKITSYTLREGATLPEGLDGIILREMSEEYMAKVRESSGSFGKRVTDFLSPYAKDGNGYKLKHGLVIPDELSSLLKTEMSEEEYKNALSEPDALLFLNPVKKEEQEGYQVRDDLKGENLRMLNYVILKSNMSGLLTFDSLHRMFDGCEQKFDKDFYNFLNENLDLILQSQEMQSQVKSMQRSYARAKRYYAVRGNNNPSYFDVITYLKEVSFEFEFGRDEFAEEVKNAGVSSQEVYDYYQKLLPRLEARKLSTIPRHQKVYVYKDTVGKEYKIMTKILRLDDPLTMLVGESKFTNCCQVYHNAGQACMEHASTSENGGILATYLIGEDGVPQMLTQSWIWTNEAKLCLDNVEATSLITAKFGRDRRLYQDIATFGLVEASKDLLESSKKAVQSYYDEEASKILSSKELTDKQKAEKIRQLDEFKARQTLKIVTVGEGCDDLNVKETFAKVESVERSQGPKGYQGYSDAGIDRETNKSKQHIILQTTDEILPTSEDYHDIAFYRDDRRITFAKGEKISHALLKKITEIEKKAHREDVQRYTRDNLPVLRNHKILASLCNCEPENLCIISGEDWYYIYSDNDKNIEVYDFARVEPRLEDKNGLQQQEMTVAFNTILRQSIVAKDGKFERLKGIIADLREDTSYLLYLYQKHLGNIEQVGNDMCYTLENRFDSVNISEQEQREILKNISKIRKEAQLKFHSVSFVPTQRTINRALEQSLVVYDERS